MSGETFNPRTKTYLAPTEALTGLNCRRFLFPRNLTLLAAVNDVLAYLSRDYVWESSSGNELEILAIRSAIASAIAGQIDCEDEDMPIGTIALFIGEAPPTGWLICNGQVYQRTDYPELYDIMPAAQFHVSDTEFNTPDMRQKFVRGADDEFPVGSTGGSDSGGGDYGFLEHNHQYQSPDFIVVNVQDGATPITVLDTSNMVTLQTDNRGDEELEIPVEFWAFNWIIRAK